LGPFRVSCGHIGHFLVNRFIKDFETVVSVFHSKGQPVKLADYSVMFVAKAAHLS